MRRAYLKKHRVAVAILTFVVLFGIIQVFKPGFLYKQDGTFMEFGLGYRNKTVFPIWLLAMVLAIMSYLFASSCST